jgi:hypothetical protein
MRVHCSMNMRNLSHLQVLVKCPQSGARPMSLALQDDVAPFGQRAFKCMKCWRLEFLRVGVGGTLISAPAGGR